MFTIYLGEWLMAPQGEIRGGDGGHNPNLFNIRDNSALPPKPAFPSPASSEGSSVAMCCHLSMCLSGFLVTVQQSFTSIHISHCPGEKCGHVQTILHSAVFLVIF